MPDERNRPVKSAGISIDLDFKKTAGIIRQNFLSFHSHTDTITFQIKKQLHYESKTFYCHHGSCRYNP